VNNLQAVKVEKSLTSVFIRVSAKDGRKWVSENIPNLYAIGTEVGGMRTWASVSAPDVPWWDAASCQETWIATQEESQSKAGHLTITISQDKQSGDVVHIWSYWVKL
jgi:hypothetical protein